MEWARWPGTMPQASGWYQVIGKATRRVRQTFVRTLAYFMEGRGWDSGLEIWYWADMGPLPAEMAMVAVGEDWFLYE